MYKSTTPVGKICVRAPPDLKKKKPLKDFIFNVLYPAYLIETLIASGSQVEKCC